MFATLVQLRAPSWKSFPPSRPLAGPSRASSNPFVEIFFPFPGNPFSPARRLAGPSRASSNAFVALRRSSWSFVDIFLPFRGNLFPLPDLWRIPLEPPPTPSWPFAVLRGPSWKSFSLFLEILSPLSDLWQSPLEPPPTPSWPFAVLSGPSWISFSLFPSWSFVDPLRGFLFFVVSIRAPSCPFVDPFVDNRDNVPSLQAAPGTFPHLC